MSRRDIASDVAAILHPNPVAFPGEEEADGFIAGCEAAAEDRARTAETLQVSWDEGRHDPLISALHDAQEVKEAAEQQIRELLAYGREFVQPRPYTLAALAAAAGLSISGVRTAYGHRDVEAVAEATGARPREWRAQDPGEDEAPS